MKKAYSYIRFSTPEQAKGSSYARQRKLCEQWCADHGLELAATEEYSFFDRGVSAFRGDHAHVGELARFLALVMDGTIEAGSTLIVESLDRLGREHIKHALPRFIDILNRGINIVSLIDKKTYTQDFTEMELIMSIFVMSRAHEESSTKAKRVAELWSEKHELAREKKIPIGNTAPLWIDFIPNHTANGSRAAIRGGRYVVNEVRANIVRRIFQMTVDGYGRAVIANVLNKEGVPSFKGKTWGTSSIHRILLNRAVLGYYQPMHKGTPYGEPIANYFDSIIDEQTFYQAQEAVKSRKLARTTKQSKRFQVWQGIAKCSACGAAMHHINKGKPPKGRDYLVCANKRKGICTAKSVRYDKSEQVFKEILAKVDSLSLVQDSHIKIEKELRGLNGRIDEQRQQYNLLQEAIAERYSKALDNAVFEAEKKLNESLRKQEELMGALAADTILNKEHFFDLLDLESYDGRYQANALLKRLEINVRVSGMDEPVYVVCRPKSIEYLDDDGENVKSRTWESILQIVSRPDEIVLVPLTFDQRERFKRQDQNESDSRVLDRWLNSLGFKTLD